MAKEVHLYMAGNDPFKLSFGETTFFIHAGLPDQGAPPAAPETPPAADDDDLVVQTPLGGAYGSYIVAPSRAGRVLEIVEHQQQVGNPEFGLAVDTASHALDGAQQLRSVLKAVANASNAHVVVHLLPVGGEDPHG